MMKTFKKYFVVIFVFVACLFSVNNLKADVIETSSSVNTDSLLTYDFEGEKTINSSYNLFNSVIEPTTFTTQNYSYNDYYNVDLSFINYDYYKNFPKYLSNFYLNVSGTFNESSTFNVNVKCDVVFNEVPMLYTPYIDTNNQTINSSFPKSVHIVSESFMAVDNYQYDMNCYFDIWLCYGYKGSGMEYLGSRIFMITSSQTASTLTELHLELYNDLTNFNTYLDSLDSGGGYDLGFNDGYNEGYEQGVIDSAPTANLTDNLFLSYGIYSNDNQILVNDLFQDSDFTQLNELKPGLIYNLITDEGASANTILISLKNIESNSGYILNMFNGEYGSFELKILGNGGKVLYTQVYDSTSYQISQLLSVVGNNIIIDAISFTFYDIQNSENFYISFTNTLLNETFENGFNVGIHEGESIGYDKGYDEGYRLGHSNGYNEGMSSQFNLGSTLLEIADIPIKVLSSMLSFEVLGINVFGLFTGLVTVLVVLWVVKKFIV